jgi:rhodanese-related sulfurtransferase
MKLREILSPTGRAFWQMAAILAVAGAIGLLVNRLRPDRLPLVAAWSPTAQLTLPSGDNLMIPLQEAEDLFLKQTALFLDARPRELYARGHIQGARSLPWEEFDANSAELIAAVSKDTPIITYCEGDACGLSKELAMALLGKGYGRVRVLVDGWTLWQESKLPIEFGLDGGT